MTLSGLLGPALAYAGRMTRSAYAKALSFVSWFALVGIAAGFGEGPNRPYRDSAPEEVQGQINAFLARFSRDQRWMMNEPPLRRDRNGVWISPDADGVFPHEAIETGDALRARDEGRARMCMNLHGKMKCLSTGIEARAEIRGNDLPETLTDNGGSGFIRKLGDLEKRGLHRAGLSREPWSGDYWPYYRGVLGARYGDPGFPGGDFAANHAYVLQQPGSAIARYGSAAEVDLLSPSEKYDLLVGDSHFSLTQTMWARGLSSADANGVVPAWMGICQGWAAAAIATERPGMTIHVRAADGRRWLRFYPTDIKALASLLWADGDYEARFIGGRCRVVSPRTDRNGRIIDPDCFDTNPGAWHLAITNQVGASRRGLVFDSTYDYEIWNQPVLGYNYYYFNPETKLFSGTLEEAQIPLERFRRDPFSGYRSAKTKTVVGIAMDLSYQAETVPTQAWTDSPQDDRYRVVRYYYDLELDSAGNVIGGEWYQNMHPDFLWVPAPGAHAHSGFEEKAVGEWDLRKPLPEAWRDAALDASGDGLPLARIVERLIEASAHPSGGEILLHSGAKKRSN